MSDALTLVWAFQPLDVLHGRTGLVECDEALAQQLISEDLAQDSRVGANHFREIVHAEAPIVVPRGQQLYKTRVLEAEHPTPAPEPKQQPQRKPPGRKRPRER